MQDSDPLNPMRPATRRADTIGIWFAIASAVFSGGTSFVEGHGVAVSLLIALAILPLAFITCILLPRHRQIAAYLWSFFDGSVQRGSMPALNQDLATAIGNSSASLSDIISRLERLERSGERNRVKIEEIGRDALVLIDATQYVITTRVMEVLRLSRPNLLGITREADVRVDELKSQIAKGEDFLREADRELRSTYHHAELARETQSAKDRALQGLAATSPEERPQGVDPYLLQSYVGIKALCDQTGLYLDRALAESERSREGYLSHLRQQMLAKQRDDAP